jgi:LPXTG-motif cell wall-anchored protein
MKNKKELFLLLFVAVLMLSALAQTVLAEKLGDECVIEVPYKAPDEIKHLKAVTVSYTLSPGLTFVSASSDGQLLIMPSTTPGYIIAIAPGLEGADHLSGVTQGMLMIRVKIQNNATNRETVNVTYVEGGSFEGDGWQGSVGTPKEHVISVDVSMRGESGDPKVTEDTTNAETDLDQTLPKTGESSGYYPWLSLLLVSVGGLIFFAQRKRISQQRD